MEAVKECRRAPSPANELEEERMGREGGGGTRDQEDGY